MRVALALFFAFILAPSSAPPRAQAEQKPLTADALPRFLTNYEQPGSYSGPEVGL